MPAFASIPHAQVHAERGSHICRSSQFRMFWRGSRASRDAPGDAHAGLSQSGLWVCRDHRHRGLDFGFSSLGLLAKMEVYPSNFGLFGRDALAAGFLRQKARILESCFRLKSTNTLEC